VVRWAWAALHDLMLQWRLASALTTVCVVYFADDRNQLNILWLALLLLEVVPRSAPISFVMRAVLVGGKALVHTTGMLLVFLYAFAILGFVFFPNKFQFRKAEIVDGTTQWPWENNRRAPCDSVWKCMIVILDQGLRKEDVGEAMDKIPWPVQTYGGECEPCPLDQVGVTCEIEKTCLEGYGNLLSWPQGKIWIRMIYTFGFFVMISAVVMQIIFGIIIDSFKQLREERENTQREINSECFICGIDRNRFDSEAAGFRHHCQTEHNMWQYMNFFIYIREKPFDSLDGPESTVYRQTAKRDISFLPMGKALSLSAKLDPRQMLHAKLSEEMTLTEKQYRRTYRPLVRKLQKSARLWSASGGRQSKAPARQDAADEHKSASVVLEIAQRLQWEDSYTLKLV